MCAGMFLLIITMQNKAIGQTILKSEDAVSGTFETGMLLETQTIETPFAKEFEFQIHHRFGLVENGFEDVFGLYAPSNIRLGLNYGITDDIMVGYGYTKDFKLQEFHGKWHFLEQTESNKIPVSIAFYGNIAIDSRKKAAFGSSYSFSDRISYFSQLIIAHKINDDFSVQIAPSFTHFNKTDTLMEHDEVAITFSGRAKITPSTAFIVEYDQPLHIAKFREYNKLHFKTENNLSFGLEIGTSTHVFQVFATNYNKITPQKNVIQNTNDFTDGDFLLGFNILVRF
jgi:hypothetical protein